MKCKNRITLGLFWSRKEELAVIQMLFSRGVAGRENRRPEFRQIANGLASHQIQSSEIKSAKKFCERMELICYYIHISLEAI